MSMRSFRCVFMAIDRLSTPGDRRFCKRMVNRRIRRTARKAIIEQL